MWENACILSDESRFKTIWLRLMMADLMRTSSILESDSTTIRAAGTRIGHAHDATTQSTTRSGPDTGARRGSPTFRATATTGNVTATGTAPSGNVTATGPGTATGRATGRATATGTGRGLPQVAISTVRTNATGGNNTVPESSQTIADEAEWHMHLLEAKLQSYSAAYLDLIDTVFIAFIKRHSDFYI